jgi:hypothetical protein
VARFRRPATIPVKHLVITTGDTVDTGTSSIIKTSQPKKEFQRTFAVDNRSVGEPSLVFEEDLKLARWRLLGVTTRLVQRVLIGTCCFSSRKKIHQDPPRMPLAFPQPGAILSQYYAPSCA